MNSRNWRTANRNAGSANALYRNLSDTRSTWYPPVLGFRCSLDSNPPGVVATVQFSKVYWTEQDRRLTMPAYRSRSPKRLVTMPKRRFASCRNARERPSGLRGEVADAAGRDAPKYSLDLAGQFATVRTGCVTQSCCALNWWLPPNSVPRDLSSTTEWRGSQRNCCMTGSREAARRRIAR